jgi:hypothetical protein
MTMTEPAGSMRSDAELVAGLRQPVRAGWDLWFTVLPSIALYTLPLAVAMALDLFRLGGPGTRSLIQFTVLFALLFLVYGSFRAPETVYFYGVRARADGETHSGG